MMSMRKVKKMLPFSCTSILSTFLASVVHLTIATILENKFMMKRGKDLQQKKTCLAMGFAAKQSVCTTELISFCGLYIHSVLYIEIFQLCCKEVGIYNVIRGE